MEALPIDPHGEAFATRLCNLLRERRRAEGTSLWDVARRSDGRYSARQLRRIERGRVEPTDAAELAALYGADLSAILPTRTPIAVDPDGRVETAGAVEEFAPGDPDDMLAAYLRLIRRLRNAERDPVVGLRRDDIVVLAGVLDEPGEHVTDRLGALMDATRTQRRVMVGLFVAGAVVVGLAVTAVAATTTDETVTSPSGGGSDGSTVAAGDVAPPDDPDADDPGSDTPVTPDEVSTGDGTAPADGEDGPDAGGTTPPPETVFVDEPWSAPVGTPGGLDVSPLPAPEPESLPAAPAPEPAPDAPAPAPAPEPEPDPTVAVGAPPVPDDPAPVVEPPATESQPEPPPEPTDAGVGVDDDGNTVAVGAPPVPEADDPLPTP